MNREQKFCLHDEQTVSNVIKQVSYAAINFIEYLEKLYSDANMAYAIDSTLPLIYRSSHSSHHYGRCHSSPDSLQLTKYGWTRPEYKKFTAFLSLPSICSQSSAQSTRAKFPSNFRQSSQI